eukprot:jgi/Tetstr1/466876/TSEL_011331.t1
MARTPQATARGPPRRPALLWLLLLAAHSRHAAAHALGSGMPVEGGAVSATQSSAFLDPASRGPYPPLLYMAGGCQGSLAVGSMARELAAAHGFDVIRTGGVENFRAKVNPYMRESQTRSGRRHTDQEDRENRHLGSSKANPHMRTIHAADHHITLPEAVERQIQEAQAGGQLHLWKLGWNGMEQYAGLPEVLHQYGARMVLLWRSNVLDALVCVVRDCMSGPEQRTGYPVDASGRRTRLCFGRRKSGAVTLARLNVEALLPELERRLGMLEEVTAKAQALGFNGTQVFASEDLLALGTGKAQVQRSLAAWSGFLTALGVRPNATTILEAWENSCEKSKCRIGAHPVKPHREIIDNYEEVKQAILASNNAAVRQLLRE